MQFQTNINLDSSLNELLLNDQMNREERMTFTANGQRKASVLNCFHIRVIIFVLAVNSKRRFSIFCH